MIYLDNAATTLKKPPEVARAMQQALESCGGAGRGGHQAAVAAENILYQCRQDAADIFHMENPERVILTCNATHALNIAIHALAKPGYRTVISGFEHNAVYRPLMALHAGGVQTTVVPTPLFEPEMALHLFEEALSKDNVCLAVCIHVSNVFGYILPVERIAEICRSKGIPMIVDASQSAGILPIRGDSYPVWCMPGHKGLYGPQGTGLLLVPPGMPLEPFMHGGTGGNSQSTEMPAFLPDRLEAGTHNAPGIAGLSAGIRHVLKQNGNPWPGLPLLQQAANMLSVIPGLRVFSSPRLFCQTGVVSFVRMGMESEMVSGLLGEQGIAVRGGMHCAPLAHKTAETDKHGTVRVGLSQYNTLKDIQLLVKALRRI